MTSDQAAESGERGMNALSRLVPLAIWALVLAIAAATFVLFPPVATTRRDLPAYLEVIASAGGNPRQEAIAHAFRTHVARARGEETAARDFEAQAMRAAGKASRGDEAFARRIRAYLDAPAWTPMSM